MEALENVCQIAQNFQRFTYVFTILVKFDFYFLGLS